MASYDPRALLDPKSRAKEKSKKRAPNYGTSPRLYCVVSTLSPAMAVELGKAPVTRPSWAVLIVFHLHLRLQPSLLSVPTQHHHRYILSIHPLTLSSTTPPPPLSRLHIRHRPRCSAHSRTCGPLATRGHTKNPRKVKSLTKSILRRQALSKHGSRPRHKMAKPRC